MQSLKKKNMLKLKSIVVIFDLTLYVKPSKGEWKQSAKFKDMAMKMEVFHTACTMLSITGNRAKDTGLQDLCVESGVIAEDSVAEVLQGHRYNSGVRLHKLVFEALMRLAWQGFRPWIEENYKQSKSIVDGLFGEIGDLYDDICKRLFQKYMTSACSVNSVHLFDKYMAFLRCESDQKTFAEVADRMMSIVLHEGTEI